jgi:hypothetical protein
MKKKQSQSSVQRSQRRSIHVPVPIPPCSVISVKRVARSPWAQEVGRVFRIGYYSQMDGLDCIWLVDERGEYDQTIDHEYLHKFFGIESLSQERSLYGRDRPKFGPLRHK